MSLRQTLAVIILAIASGTCWSASDTPRWIDIQNDPELWLSVKDILKEELTPDDPHNMPEHQAASLYKYVYKIMQADGSALVIIGESMNKSHSRSLDYFKAYSVNLKTKKKSLIGDKGYSLWRFVKWANFEKSVIPDTVFSFETCTECESTSLLGSFQFDSQTNRWKMRKWPENNPDVTLGGDVLVGDYWHGDDDDYSTTCLYSVRDFNNDGLSDIATSCRTKGANKGWKPVVISLYTVTAKGPQLQQVEGIAAKALRQKLCKEQFKKSLCS